MLIKHSALYFLARSLPGLINFLAIPVYTRILTPADYGHYSLVLAVVGLFNVVFFEWLKLSLLRYLPVHLENPRALLSTVLASFSTLAIFTGMIGLLFFWFWPDPGWRFFILLAIPFLWVQSWFELNLELVRSRFQPIRYGLMSWVKALCALILGVSLVYSGLGAYGPLIGLLAGMLLVGLYSAWTEWKGSISGFSWSLLGELLRYGLPFTATFALNFIGSYSDRFLIAMCLDERMVGVYTAAYDLSQQGLAYFMMVVNLAAYPLVVQALEQNGPEAAKAQLHKNATLFMSLSFPATVGLIVLAPNVSEVLLGSEFRKETTGLIPWIAMAILFSGLRSYHFDLAFQLSRHTVRQVWVLGLAALSNLVLNLCFIPVFGLQGVAYATFLTYLLALILSIFLGRKVFSIPFPYKDGIKIALASIIMGLLLWPSLQYKGLYILVAQVLVGGLVYAVLVGLFNVGDYRTKIIRKLVA